MAQTCYPKGAGVFPCQGQLYTNQRTLFTLDHLEDTRTYIQQPETLILEPRHTQARRLTQDVWAKVWPVSLLVRY